MSTRLSMLCGFIAAMVLPGAVSAEILSTHLTYKDRLTSRDITALKDEVFGDSISLSDGQVNFAQVDISLPTNSGLPVALGRHTPKVTQLGDVAFSPFGFGWELDVPYMMGTYDERNGWNAGGSTARCSSSNLMPMAFNGPWPNYHTQLVPQHMYWDGINIHIPGKGDELLLKKNPLQAVPTDGKTYIGTTANDWRVRCLTTIKNGAGEGFAVLTPDGLTYNFDWMALRNAPDLVTSGAVTDSNGEATDSWDLLTPRVHVFLFASKVTDRFGNWVQYTYDPANPGRLLSIHSSDDANTAATVRIDLQYENGRVARAIADGKTWTYQYTTDYYKALASVTLPDQTKWKFSGELHHPGTAMDQAGFYVNECSEEKKNFTSAATTPAYPHTYRITHPSGASAEFVFRSIIHGTNDTPGDCTILSGGPHDGSPIAYGVVGIPSASARMSLERKSITSESDPTGAKTGFAPRTWTYTYYPTWTFEDQCNSGCANSTSRTKVTTSDGLVRNYTFGNDYNINVGQLLRETVERGAAVLQDTTYTYASSATGYLFPDNVGDRLAGVAAGPLYGNPFTVKRRPRVSTTEVIDGRRFTRTVNAFDAFARPTKITKTSQPN